MPTEHEAAVVNELVTNIRSLGNHTDVGLVGSRYLLQVLSRYGHSELALAIATNPDPPGWGSMATGTGSLHDAPGTIWENWCDTEGVGTSKNHPAFAGGIGSFLYELAGLAEEGDCSTGLVLRPLRGTLRQLGSAHLELEVPQGMVEFTWRYVESTTGVWQQFEANVSLPAQLPKPVQLHILASQRVGGYRDS